MMVGEPAGRIPQPGGIVRAVHVVALNGIVPFDLAIPCEVFGRATLPGTRQSLYEIRVCSETDTVRAGHFELRCPWRLDGLVDANTVIVPGIEDIAASVPDPVAAALRVLSALAPASTIEPKHRVRYAAVRMLITVRERERICRRQWLAGTCWLRFERGRRKFRSSSKLRQNLPADELLLNPRIG
jgi:hypothetical protein